MIPKVIHYCWFGDNKKGALVEKCMQSWQECLPGYEIKCWNEHNSILDHPFAAEAYKNKKWAFVADYVRLKVLYDEGGIYFDTDVLVLKPFDDLLIYPAFIGFEDEEKLNVAVCGAEKGHHFIAACLSRYDNLPFNVQNTIPLVVTGVAKDFGLIINNQRQRLAGVEIFPTAYFYAYPYKDSFLGKDFQPYIQPESYAIHLWDVSWSDNREFRLLKQGRWLEWLKIFLKNPIRDLKYYNKSYQSIKQHFSAK